jgi:hypothetical protein
MMQFLEQFARYFAPDVAINPAATASATTALQGQFSTIDAATAIARKTAASNLGIACVLRSSRVAGASIDTTSVLEIIVDAGAGRTCDSITVTTGTVIRQQVGGQIGSFLVRPNASGVVNVVATNSGTSAAATVTVGHRTFWSTTATVSTV